MNRMCILAITLLTVSAAGCKEEHFQPKGAQEAAYVRDPSHECKLANRVPGHDDWDSWDHKVEYVRGYKYFACEGGISLIVYEDEAQP